METFAETPFAVLTIIVAPAILTNASSVLSLGTGNRIGRVVDRTRILAAELAQLEPGTPLAAAVAEQLAQLKARAWLLLMALRCFYASIGGFAAAALLAVVGTIVAPGLAVVFGTTAVLGVLAGLVGVGGLVVGGALMVRETQLAVRFLEREAEASQLRS